MCLKLQIALFALGLDKALAELKQRSWDLDSQNESTELCPPFHSTNIPLPGLFLGIL